MPDGCLPVGRLDVDVEEALGDGEEAVEDGGEREVRAQLLVGDRILRLLEALGVVGDVPVLEVPDKAGGGGVRLDVREVGARGRDRGGAQLLEEIARARERRHLRGHRDLGEVLVAEQLSLLRAQCQHAVDHGAVVRVAARRARDVGAVHLLTERAVLRVRHDWEEGRKVEGQQPGPGLGRRAVVPGGDGLLRGERARRGREARDAGDLGDELLVGLGRVEEVVGELGRELGELLREVEGGGWGVGGWTEEVEFGQRK